MTIGLVIACDAEFNAFIKHLEKVKIKAIEKFVFCIGFYKGKKVIAIKSGVGKTNASFCCQKLIDAFKIDIMLNIGACGGLDKGLKISDILIVDKACFWDIKKDFLQKELCEIKTDEKLLKFAIKVLGKIKTCSLATGDNFVESKELKEKILNTFNSVACDMEGMAIAQVCYKNNIKFLIIKGVSDNGDSMKIFEENFEDISKKVALCALNIIENLNKQILRKNII